MDMSDQVNIPTSQTPAYYQTSQHLETNQRSFQDSTPSSPYFYRSTPLAPHEPPSLSSNLAGSPPRQRYSTSPSIDSLEDMDESNSMRMEFIERVPPQLVQLPPSPPKRPSVAAGYKLTMGYRGDCDKCLRKEPGHYSHLELLVPTLDDGMSW